MVVGAGHWQGEGMALVEADQVGRTASERRIDGEIMSAPRDKFGRPIVVVTGMGVVTSLGAGKTTTGAS